MDIGITATVRTAHQQQRKAAGKPPMKPDPDF